MRQRILLGLIIFSLLMSGSTMTLQAKSGANVKLVIYQQPSWKNCKKPTLTMRYRLSGEADAPMPVEAVKNYHDYKMKFNKRKMGITIHYTKPGLYSYYVKQNCKTKYKGMRYDRNVYHVRVLVQNSNGILQVTQELPVNKKGFKEENMTFHNSYNKESKKNSNSNSSSKGKNPRKNVTSNKNGGINRKHSPTKVKTGDTTMINVWIITMMGSFIVLLLCIVSGKRKENEDEDENRN